MDRSKFSIIIPVYNVEQYLDACVASVLAQTCPDFELILVDDGSTDQSRGICDRYAAQDARVKVIHQENGGVSRARNKGLDRASGEWICFVDSDDEVEPDWLEHYARSLDADLLAQGMREIFPDGKVLGLPMPDQYVKGKERLNLHVRKHCLFSPIKCFRADVIHGNRLRFIEDMHSAEDLTFVLNFMAASESIRFIPYEGYIYNHQYSTLTNRFYPFDVRSEWSKQVFKIVIDVCEGNKTAILYKSIVQQSFTFQSQYVTVNYGKLTKRERYATYQALRAVYQEVDFRDMKWTRLVFLLLPLPNKLFDLIICACSKIWR